MARKAKGKGKGKAGRKRSRQGKAGGGVSKWAKYNTNSLERRMGTRKENRCQLCLTKADLDDQFTVINDLDAGTVKKSKNAGLEKNEHLSHYCGDCADKRVARKEYWMENVREASGPDQRGKTGGSGKSKPKRKRVRKGKAKTKAKAKGKKKAAGKKAPRKRTRKTRAKSDAKPKRQRRRGKAKAAEAEGDDEPF